MLWERAKHRKEGAGEIAVWRRIGGAEGRRGVSERTPGLSLPSLPGKWVCYVFHAEDGWRCEVGVINSSIGGERGCCGESGDSVREAGESSKGKIEGIDVNLVFGSDI